ncbi:hypothetical protein HPB49_006707 [Dermacentor silvarum]|uniref:Uncharacterized protein n=1 Tax=Dermacentor silvarum TaxID=543639 RepID=A0ACB8DWF9_DERSI|nr:hypothetical protein HPB49_006707 [Dermacentor silvarum]
MSAKAVSSQVRQRETEMWRMAMDTKSTLQLYKACKTDIHREDFYDNSVGSSLLFEARAGALRTLAYRHHCDSTIASTMCRACGEEDECIEHLVLRCKKLPTLLPEDATLARTLGFRSPEDATSGNGDEFDLQSTVDEGVLEELECCQVAIGALLVDQYCDRDSTSETVHWSRHKKLWNPQTRCPLQAQAPGLGA